MRFYCEAIEEKEDSRKYRKFLTDRERMIGEELLHCDILKYQSSTAWLDNLMKEWEKTYTQFIQVFSQAFLAQISRIDERTLILSFYLADTCEVLNGWADQIKSSCRLAISGSIDSRDILAEDAQTPDSIGIYYEEYP
ncbi:9441_t:CDS:2 [Funneliformis mosseae]|uniref:9441_t:CDS:1 n=1 Tax=Funneliformis mosseae TaxID=27381 RepID=A0A9N9DD11_FUNMO|nr:9441_t:CDS:2 [Funneliformis mosseae]